ncbi:MAG TPA: fumarylacetoacetate hydrolase family protein [Xanthobacteraceae bacterium]|jgi:2-keto-4-pentenoate hydratase/2-oxohepta-3-ene-1,7-dioic acid hydratase in catechol pathway|nr:fumarylacetoacetate hydrolase family protein [Xanthobacteraceae bacterium]
MWALATAKIDARPTACMRVDGKLFALAALDPSLPNTLVDIFADWPAYAPRLDRLAGSIDSKIPAIPDGRATLLAPLLYPGKVLCAGANYYDHMAEMGFPDVKKETQRLFFFLKPSRNAVVGPGPTVKMPRGTQKYDWEIELAAVIGKSARYVTPQQALDHVAGYTVAIDMSARDFNMAPDQFYKFDWVAGKATDTGCPLGPWIVPAAALGDPQKVALKLAVNGEIKQNSSTAKMIYSIAEQITRASEIMTLDPGDVILTGIPAGVGVPKGTFLKVGDRIDAEIAGIGTLSVSIAAMA